jgi:hypothetical protein
MIGVHDVNKKLLKLQPRINGDAELFEILHSLGANVSILTTEVSELTAQMKYYKRIILVLLAIGVTVIGARFGHGQR